MSSLFISKYAKQSARLALLTSLLAFVVILLGAYTRLTNAGLSCPDWPNCYGYLTAPHTALQIQNASALYPETPVNVKAAWTEMTHRYFAGFEGLLILLLCFRLFKSKLTVNAIALLGLLTLQVTLGMLTVTEKLKPVIVLSHLLTGLSILSVLWYTYLCLAPNNKKQDKRATPWLIGALIIVALQITLGGWVSTHYAGLACIDFPYCNGVILPELKWSLFNSDLVTIHMLHRIGALITACYFIIMTIVFCRHNIIPKTMFHLLGILALQITLGILNLFWLRPVWLALLHHGVGILLLLSVIAVLTRNVIKSRIA